MCLKCCLWCLVFCLDTWLLLVGSQAYVVMARTGDGYCRSMSTAFLLVRSQLFLVGTLCVITWFIIQVGRGAQADR